MSVKNNLWISFEIMGDCLIVQWLLKISRRNEAFLKTSQILLYTSFVSQAILFITCANNAFEGNVTVKKILFAYVFSRNLMTGKVFKRLV